MNTRLDPMLAYKALQRVARGEIVSACGLLRHHDDVLPPNALLILGSLRDGGYIKEAADSGGAVPMSLTLSGTQLLDMCNRQPGSSMSALFRRFGDAASDEFVAARAAEVVRHDARS
jgi:hypothetical protein